VSDVLINGSVTRIAGNTARQQVMRSADEIFVFNLEGYYRSTDAGVNWSSFTAYMTGVTQTHGPSDLWYPRWLDPAAPDVVYGAVGEHTVAAGTGVTVAKLDLATRTLIRQGRALTVTASNDIANQISVTQARDGALFATCQTNFFPGTGTVRSTDDGVSWSAVANLASADIDDWVILFPDYSSADPADICALWWDHSASSLYLRQLDVSGNSVSSTLITAGVEGFHSNNAFNAFSPQNWAYTLDPATGHLFVVVIDQWSASPMTCLSFEVFGASVTAHADVFTTQAWSSGPSLSLAPDGTFYCFYGRAQTLAQLTSSQTIFYRTSSDGMASWSAETQLSAVTTYTNEYGYADPTPRFALQPVWYDWSLFDLRTPGTQIPVTPPLAVPQTANVAVAGALAVPQTANVAIAVPVAILKCKTIDGVRIIKDFTVSMTNLTATSVDSLRTVVKGNTVQFWGQIAADEQVYSTAGKTITATIRQLRNPDYSLGAAFDDIPVTPGNTDVSAAAGGVLFEVELDGVRLLVPTSVVAAEPYFVRYYVADDDYRPQILIFGLARDL
jgi:hypothetical protein